MSVKGFKSLMSQVAPPYREMYDGIRPNLGDDVRVFPGLPRLRSAQDDLNGPNSDYIVIEAGEPIAIVTIGGAKWIVPAAVTAYTLTYSAIDIDEVEDVDSLGSLVASAAASSASVPAAAPIGVTPHPIRQNARLTTGEMMYDNYDRTDKEIVNRSRMFMIPYRRRGVNAVETVKEGDLIAVGSINGNTLSASNRPRLVPADMTPSGAGEGTAATIVFTSLQANFANIEEDEVLSLTVDGVTAEFVPGTDFVTGANADAFVANFAEAINASALAPKGTAVASTSADTVTFTANIKGDLDCAASVDSGATGTDITVAVNEGVASTSALHADSNINSLNVGLILGRCVRAWETLPANFDLSKAATPDGSGAAGSDTKGIPQDLYVRGNSSDTSSLPTTFAEAGALLIAYSI